jgi:hypothetical protein
MVQELSDVFLLCLIQQWFLIYTIYIEFNRRMIVNEELGGYEKMNQCLLYGAVPAVALRD